MISLLFCANFALERRISKVDSVTSNLVVQQRASDIENILSLLQATIHRSHSDTMSAANSEVLSAHRNVGNYRGTAVFVKFLPFESLTLSRDDLLDLKLVRRRCALIILCRIPCKRIFCIIRPHHSTTQTRFSNVTDGVAWSVGRSISLSVCHDREPCKNC